MTPGQRILSIRLSEKLAKNPEYAQSLGVKATAEEKDRKEKTNKSFAEQSVNYGQ